MERLFIGWHRPTLRAAADILWDRYAGAGGWDLGGVLLVLPGRWAARRLVQILRCRAEERRLRLTLPETVTPAGLPEHLYAAPPELATPLEAHCAWLAAARRLGAAGAVSAEQAQAARAALMAEGLTLADAAGRCAALPGFCEDARWGALARLEVLYQEALAQAGRTDRDDARRRALRSGALSCRREVFLVGAADLSAVERGLLRGLTTPVTALVAAPPESADGFDDVGGLRADFWQGLPLPLPDGALRFVADPAAEAHALAGEVAALRGGGTAGQVTLGVADEADAEGLARRLAARGLPTRSPYGRSLSRVRPAALLHALQDYLRDPSARRFAALVRHPDLEAWLGAGEAPSTPALLPRQFVPHWGEGGQKDCPLLTPSPAKSERARERVASLSEPGEGAAGLLDVLDVYLADHLPERLPDDGLPPVVAEAQQAVAALLGPFGGTRPLPEWADPIGDILRAVYGPDEPPDDHAEGRQLRRALSALAATLDAVRGLGPALAPRLSGRDALAFVLGRLGGPRLPDDAAPDALEMRGWLELALDDAPALLVTGLHEAPPPADSLLPDTLRRHLGLPGARHRGARDAYLLRVLLEARPHVRLFVSRRGPDGEPRRPSPLLFRCDGETAARRARQFTDGAEEAPPALFTPGETRRLGPPRPAPLPAPLARLRVTAFRDYLACPYRFYLRHVLHLDERDDAADEMDARRFGLLLHACLEAFARAPVAESPDADVLGEFLRRELSRQAQRQFGPELPPALRLQVRQAGRRLDEFARWQAHQTAAGWLIQHDLSERDLEAEVMVDDRSFTVAGRLDRVDYHPGEDRYRIVDYKTGDSGQSPDDKHRGKVGADGLRPWTDLQLPLYRLLAGANGIDPERLEVGYILLAADLRAVTPGRAGRPDGGLGYVPACWDEADWAGAHDCMAGVIRALRAETFWPPAAPPRFADALSPLCLDRCRDRAAWLEEDDP